MFEVLFESYTIVMKMIENIKLLKIKIFLRHYFDRDKLKFTNYNLSWFSFQL